MKADVLDGRAQSRPCWPRTAASRPAFTTRWPCAWATGWCKSCRAFQLPDGFGTAGVRSAAHGTTERTASPATVDRRAWKTSERHLPPSHAEIAGGRTDAAQAWRRVNGGLRRRGRYVSTSSRGDDALVEIGMTTFWRSATSPTWPAAWAATCPGRRFGFSCRARPSPRAARGRAAGRRAATGWTGSSGTSRKATAVLGQLIDQWFLDRPLCRRAGTASAGRRPCCREWTAGPAGPGPVRAHEPVGRHGPRGLRPARRRPAGALRHLHRRRRRRPVGRRRPSPGAALFRPRHLPPRGPFRPRRRPRPGLARAAERHLWIRSLRLFE